MSFAGYFLSVLFCLLSMLISDSRFDLVWFRLSCDHGWIRSGSVNVRKDPFNDWGGGGGYNNFAPNLGGDGTKKSLTRDIFDPLFGGISLIRGKLADHVGDHVVLSPEGAVLVTSTGTESSYPRPPQSLNNSKQQQQPNPPPAPFPLKNNHVSVC